VRPGTRKTKALARGVRFPLQRLWPIYTEFKAAKRGGSIELVLRIRDMAVFTCSSALRQVTSVVIGGGDDTLRGNIRDQITGREVGETLHRTGKSVLSDDDVGG
jgi:hypothetical protein